jgi:hypothetical protein
MKNLIDSNHGIYRYRRMLHRRYLRYGQGRRLEDWPVSIGALIGGIYGRLSEKHGIMALSMIGVTNE